MNTPSVNYTGAVTYSILTSECKYLKSIKLVCEVTINMALSGPLQLILTSYAIYKNWFAFIPATELLGIKPVEIGYSHYPYNNRCFWGSLFSAVCNRNKDIDSVSSYLQDGYIHNYNAPIYMLTMRSKDLWDLTY